MPTSLQVLTVVVGLSAVWLLKKVLERKPPGKPIPGPRGLPIIGNLLDVPTEDEYRVFSSWQKKYGDIVQMTVLGQPLIILNSPRLCVEMLNKKSLIYSSRPHLPMACDLVGWKDVLVLLPYNDKFKACRRMMQQVIGTRSSVDQFRNTLETEASHAVRRLLNEPENFAGPVRKAVGAIILMISHGYKVKSETDPLVRIADVATDQLGVLLSPGMFAVDLIPALRFIPEWFPGGGFHKIAREWRHTLFDLTDKSYEFVLEQMKAGTATPNFVSNLLEGKKNLSQSEEEEIKWAASSLYSGGADTPVSAMSSFFLAMTMYPDVQKKCQAELDAVVGNDRLLTFSDRDSLPYISTMIKEVIRWGPTTPLGAPHCLEQDDVHDGYHIPKGAIILANIWHFLHDPEVYPDPMTFNPDRLIASPGKPAQMDPYDVCFGYGRRACPGSQLAQSIMYIFCATILSVFDIQKVTVDGVVQEPKHEFTNGVLVRPKPFQSKLVPRSAKAEALIRTLEDFHVGAA
ncbi:cytochrome P450 [Auriscalpium vulgare]|uniref:Cytochrome P450 n=1 Tax=Auriscalpium vulgare TaxID=40419 RepID=A0ACB8RRJ8_9AGAM|nr:cytochrome P450 [Auriscalpium vulgare]